MYIIGKEISDTEFYNLVVENQEVLEDVKRILGRNFSDNDILKEKLENLSKLKAENKISYLSDKSNKLFEE